MEQIFILDDLHSKIDKDTVLNSIDCKIDSPVYEDVAKEFDSIYPEAMSLVEPTGIIGFGTVTENASTVKYPTGTKVLFAVLSVGDKIKQRSTKAFDEGDYVAGMLFDAMADCALFSLESSLAGKLKEICAEHNIGISARLEAPHDISMQIQKDAWQQLDLKGRLGIDITEGYMLDPVKTSCQLFVISDDTDDFKVQHNCRKCNNFSCKFRNVVPAQIKVKKGNAADTFLLKENETLMDGLIREGHYVSAVCGGKGRCGKCKVRVIKGEAAVSGEDKKFFSKQEIDNGWRLSCTLRPDDDLTIEFDLATEEDFEVVSDFAVSKDTVSADKENQEYKIAIDIGTTTIAFELISNTDILHTVTMINHQRQYGADVVSRIQASVDGKGNELRECIRTDLKNGILKLCSEYGVTVDKITDTAVACNTTMSHLLMGYDCESLGKYPFTPVNIDFIAGTMEEITGIQSDVPMSILPGISTYVGGDIVSGLFACGFDRTDDVCLLIDLGTNGEMALGNCEKILVTSTAAGPAFEGGNISHGTGSVDGAICSVSIDGGKTHIQTIREKSPVGICGTGVVELTAELIKNELVDETGLLDEDYFDDGFPVAKTADGEDIVFTQKDVREIQLAKAAIRAGAETLIKRYGISKEQISKVYIAGGFGYKLDIKKAIAIGMLPDEFSDSTKAVGNSSLAGVVKYLREPSQSFEKLIKVSEEISLSTDNDFNECYMNAMMFIED